MRLLIISLLVLFLSLILLVTGNSFLTTLLGLGFGLLGVEVGTIDGGGAGRLRDIHPHGTSDSRY